LPAARLARLAHAAAACALLMAAWSAGTAQAQTEPPATPLRLPALGDATSDDLDINQERRLGDSIMRDIRRDPDYLDDPLLSEYLDSLVQPLLKAARERGAIDADIQRAFAWQSFLVRDRAVNAFALPGGYVGVYLGLVGMTATPEELASVLAHELTHVTQRHIARSMTNSSHQGMATMAAMILGLLAASHARNIDGAQAVVVGSQALMAQGQLNFSRDMEREADRIGLDLMGDAGFATGGMAAMFEKLDNASRLNDSGMYPYLRSHPLTSERISEARLRIGTAPAHAAVSRVDHLLMQARARVLMDSTEGSLRRQQAMGQPGSPLVDAARLAALYGAAMASTQLRDFDRAEQAIAAGLGLADQQFASEPHAARAFALLRLTNLIEHAASPGLPTASVLQQMAATLAPLAGDRTRALLLARAQVALARGRLGDAQAPGALRASTEDLQTWVAEHKGDALAWQLLSQCAEPLGLHLRSLRAGAESAMARGDVLGAVDRFRAAQRVAKSAGPDEYLEASIIESRLREVEHERRRQMAEARGERVE
jgi:predicted Zn-dependent protease